MSDSTRNVCGVPRGAKETRPAPPRFAHVCTHAGGSPLSEARSIDDPGGDVAVEHVKGLVLWVGVKRRGSAPRKQALPQRKPAARVLAGEPEPSERAEKPAGLAAG